MNDEEKMVIGYDASPIGQDRTGLSNYCRTLLNGMASLGRYRLNVYGPSKCMQLMQTHLVRCDSLVCIPWRSTVKSRLWGDRVKIRQLEDGGVRIFHCLDGMLPHFTDRAGIRTVVTIPHLIPLVHPEYYPSGYTRRFSRHLERIVTEADSLVVTSECTKRDLCRLASADAGKVRVIYQSCAPRFMEEPSSSQMWHVRDKYELPDRYVLNVGSLEERKNVLLAVKALRHLPDDVSLVIVGRQTPYSDMLHDYVLENRMQSRVQMLHNVPDDYLPALYRMADCFVYPSCYEGFALPIVEAISQGLPVVACTGSSLEEAGGPDSLYVAPDDDKGMAHAVAQVLFGAPGRQKRIERSRHYVSRFEAADMAQSYANLYQELLNA